MNEETSIDNFTKYYFSTDLSKQFSEELHVCSLPNQIIIEYFFVSFLEGSFVLHSMCNILQISLLFFIYNFYMVKYLNTGWKI